MAWTPFQFILAVIMVVTGSINTLSTKWADHLMSKGSDDVERHFEHPFVQAVAMFLGEFLCLIVFKCIFFYNIRKGEEYVTESNLLRGSQSFNPLILFPAAMFDMIGTSIMYVGLNYTYASSFQMFRGSVIIFVAVLSMVLLKRKISIKQWLGILFVILGLIVVGVSDFIQPDNTENHDQNSVITGDLLIILAQVSTAVQMVYEEKYVQGKDIPALQAVGWEGLFGLVVMSILLIPFYYIKVGFADNPRGVLEDFLEAMIQLGNNQLLIISLVGTIISIAFFNYSGISVTKELSATTRMILDSVRTIFIWMISLLLHWEFFHGLQIPGFILLILGTCVYNNLLPTWQQVKTCVKGPSEVLIDSNNEEAA